MNHKMTVILGSDATLAQLFDFMRDTGEYGPADNPNPIVLTVESITEDMTGNAEVTFGGSWGDLAAARGRYLDSMGETSEAPETLEQYPITTLEVREQLAVKLIELMRGQLDKNVMPRVAYDECLDALQELEGLVTRADE